MKKYCRTIGGSISILSIVVGSYLLGQEQNPTFDELPQKARAAIIENHHDLDSLLTQAINQYQWGNSQKALELYRQAEEEAESLKKIDPHYEEIQTKMSQYSAA